MSRPKRKSEQGPRREGRTRQESGAENKSEEEKRFKRNLVATALLGTALSKRPDEAELMRKKVREEGTALKKNTLMGAKVIRKMTRDRSYTRPNLEAR